MFFQPIFIMFRFHDAETTGEEGNHKKRITGNWITKE